MSGYSFDGSEGMLKCGGGASLAILTPFAIPVKKSEETPEQFAERSISEKINWIQKATETLDGEMSKLKTDSAEYEKLKSLHEKFKDFDKTDLNLKEEKTFKILLQEHTDLMAKMKAMEENPQKEVGYKTFREALMAAFLEKKSEIDEIVKSGIQKASLKIIVKAAATMTETSNTLPINLTTNTGITTTIRKRELTYLANVSVGSLSGNRALWIEQTDEEGTPIMLAEGATKTQLDVQHIEATESVKKIAVFGKVTTELMADIPQLISYIQNNLMKRMDIVLENQLFSGTGVGDNLKGVETYATAFSAGALANAIADANELDVMEAIALQVKLAFGIPNALFINPSTMAKIKLIKDSTGRPVWKDYVTADGFMTISGMKIIETTAKAADDFVGGDMTVVNVLNREDIGIQIGLDGNDFTQNKKTMLMEKRLVQFVSANDTAVLVKGDFTTAKAALLAP